MDWVIPIGRKSQMTKDMPGGMAGACQVKWESHSANPIVTGKQIGRASCRERVLRLV